LSGYVPRIIHIPLSGGKREAQAKGHPVKVGGDSMSLLVFGRVSRGLSPYFFNGDILAYYSAISLCEKKLGNSVGLPTMQRCHQNF
jgi:hypothetical protein